jgi:hypothetical protein
MVETPARRSLIVLVVLVDIFTVAVLVNTVAAMFLDTPWRLALSALIAAIVGLTFGGSDQDTQLGLSAIVAAAFGASTLYDLPYIASWMNAAILFAVAFFLCEYLRNVFFPTATVWTHTRITE